MNPPRSRRTQSASRSSRQEGRSNQSKYPHLFPVETTGSPQPTSELMEAKEAPFHNGGSPTELEQPASLKTHREQRRATRRRRSSQPQVSNLIITRRSNSGATPRSQLRQKPSTGRVVNFNAPNAQHHASSDQDNQSREVRHHRENRVVDFGRTVLRLLVCGVGLGAIAGTVLAKIAPTPSTAPAQSESQAISPVEDTEEPTSPGLEQEITALQEKLAALVAEFPELEAGAFFVDLDNGAYVELEGTSSFAAASTIKIPVLVAFFQDVAAQKIRLDEMMTMKPELIAGESGDMQYQEPGTQFSALETATKMITISDNTATNMLIERLGGAEALNRRFQEWGLQDTAIRTPLPDLEGTNTTSPRDLAQLLTLVEQGKLVSGRSRDRLLHIMQGTVTKTLLPQGLEKEALIAHKTGDIGTVIGDAGIIDMPSGKRYVATVLVKRPHNDPQARTLIQAMSKTVYQHLKWYQPRPFTEEAESSEPLDSEQSDSEQSDSEQLDRDQ
ncbi:MAG: serine hydrolase [Cyanophyceae cyanobacterium]